jgi:hypothetical protein
MQAQGRLPRCMSAAANPDRPFFAAAEAHLPADARKA